ncbi:hypothetical protein C8R48DRAFT_783022 [Suillus tomentosus]|nr:hypothetical protein C8R48DRAFT_783022 [Suillus tomentosus]
MADSVEKCRVALRSCPPGHYCHHICLVWATFAEETNYDSVLVACQTALKFLDQHVTLLSPSLRHFDIVRMATSSVATDAFSCSVRRGALTTAVELVEQGRAVFRTRLTRLRLPLDELSLSSDTGAALAKELQQLSFRLCSAFDKSTEDQSLDIQQLTMQWDDVVSRICMMSAFSRFLLPPLFSDLRKAAEKDRSSSSMLVSVTPSPSLIQYLRRRPPLFGSIGVTPSPSLYPIS